MNLGSTAKAQLVGSRLELQRADGGDCYEEDEATTLHRRVPRADLDGAARAGGHDASDALCRGARS
jgi:hypothetical protein